SGRGGRAADLACGAAAHPEAGGGRPNGGRARRGVRQLDRHQRNAEQVAAPRPAPGDEARAAAQFAEQAGAELPAGAGDENPHFTSRSNRPARAPASAPRKIPPSVKPALPPPARNRYYDTTGSGGRI